MKKRSFASRYPLAFFDEATMCNGLPVPTWQTSPASDINVTVRQHLATGNVAVFLSQQGEFDSDASFAVRPGYEAPLAEALRYAADTLIRGTVLLSKGGAS